MIRSLRTTGILYAGFLLVTFLIYGRMLTAEFVTLDDGLLIYQNPTVQGMTLGNIIRAFTSYDPELYIPLTFLTYQIDYMLGGTEPFFYHLQNLLWHAGNGVLVTLLVWQLLTPARRGQVLSHPLARLKYLTPVLTPALLFLVHPINTEAVAWAAARKDLVSTFFFLLSLLLYIAAEIHESPLRKGAYVASVATFTLALMGKASAVTLPVVLALVDWHRQKGSGPFHSGRPSRGPDPRVLTPYLPYLLLSFLFGIIALVGKSGGQPFSPLLAVMSVTFSLQKFFFPVHLSVGYPYTEEVAITSPDFLISLLGFVGFLGVLGLCLYKRWRLPALGLAFFLITLIPSFFNLSKGLENYLGADRYLYLPAIGLIILIGYGLSLMRGWTLPFAALLLVPLSVMAHNQSLTWRSSEALYRNVLHLYPESSGAHINLGNEFRKTGRFDEAIAEYDTAITLRDSPKAHYNKGVTLEALGRTAEAIASYEAAIVRDPTYDYAHVNLGKLYYVGGRKDEALREFELAATFAPYLALAHFNIGYIHAERGGFAAAVDAYHRALDADPNFIDARVNLVIALARLGRQEEAQREYTRLLQEAPDHPSVRELQRLID